MLTQNIHSFSSGSHIAVLPLRSRRAQLKTNSNSNKIKEVGGVGVRGLVWEVGFGGLGVREVGVRYGRLGSG